MARTTGFGSGAWRWLRWLLPWLLLANGAWASEVLSIEPDVPETEVLEILPAEDSLEAMGISIEAVDEEQPLSADTWHWYGQEARADVVHLYFFWNRHCPHCKAAKPFLVGLTERLDWLSLHSFEVSENEDNLDRFILMAESLGEEANGVPAFLACQGLVGIGYDTHETSGAELEQYLLDCHRQVLAGHPPSYLIALDEEDATDFGANSTFDMGKNLRADPQRVAAALDVPLIGKIDARQFSLPVYTLVIAGLDAFNPCAFFVLLFLLSLLVHARSRWRMLFIGGVFVFFSGLIYFLFMAAWLNLFRYMGEMQVITFIAGLVAVVVSLINIKDFLFFKQGPSLSIPESAKPGLFQRMRKLLEAGSFASLTLGTITLAIAANTYELLCTSGFPMIYTRILTLEDLSPTQYYLYLVLYNVIYVLPLLAIVLVFTYTLGARKLQESEGRMLKLLSGLMMLGLGGVLLLAPHLLNNMLTAILILVVALAVTAIAKLSELWYQTLFRPPPIRKKA